MRSRVSDFGSGVRALVCAVGRGFGSGSWGGANIVVMISDNLIVEMLLAPDYACASERRMPDKGSPEGWVIRVTTERPGRYPSLQIYDVAIPDASDAVEAVRRACGDWFRHYC
jgi:hypothetical protein